MQAFFTVWLFLPALTPLIKNAKEFSVSMNQDVRQNLKKIIPLLHKGEYLFPKTVLASFTMTPPSIDITMT